MSEIKKRSKGEKLRRYQDSLKRMKERSGFSHKDAQRYFSRYRKRLHEYQRKVKKSGEHEKLFWIQKYNDEVTQQRYREGIFPEPNTNYFEGTTPD